MSQRWTNLVNKCDTCGRRFRIREGVIDEVMNSPEVWHGEALMPHDTGLVIEVKPLNRPRNIYDAQREIMSCQHCVDSDLDDDDREEYIDETLTDLAALYDEGGATMEEVAIALGFTI